jgi:NAD(P)-dependent dehydrogenase (short-subunit alcohol dehydrogenase family)
MVDSNEGLLDEQAKETKEKSYHPDTKVISMHFDLKGSNHWQDYDKLCKQIHEITKEQEISILVNNAEEFDPFGPKIHRAKDEDVLGTLSINTYPMVFMSRFLGPELKRR